MGDIKLFSIHNQSVRELEGQAIAIEKSLQYTIEKNLEIFLGIRFLATEYSTGKKHVGRIDTLGIDENNSPVIIEYKRSINENVINQGLFYLDWLMDHKAEFELMVLKRYGSKVSNSIEWSSPRLLCIAGGFTKYDEHAVQQINRNIELYQYKHFDEGSLLLDLVNATTAQTTYENVNNSNGKSGKHSRTKTVTDNLEAADSELTARYEALESFVEGLGDDMQKKVLKNYIAYKRIKNFICIEVHPSNNDLRLFLKVNPNKISLEKGFSRDVTHIGHWGTGDLELIINSDEDLEKAKPYISMSYDNS
jgi:predicted transport protein